MNESLQKILLVAAGAALGAVARYLISSAFPADKCFLPWGTLIVNIVGGFAIGFIMGLAPQFKLSSLVQTFLTTGMLGGLTTFSTFSNETISLYENGAYLAASVNMVANVVGALVACWIGHLAARIV